MKRAVLTEHWLEVPMIVLESDRCSVTKVYQDDRHTQLLSALTKPCMTSGGAICMVLAL